MSKKKKIIAEDFLANFDRDENKTLSIPKCLTIMPLRDIVIYPFMIFPVLIGRSSSLKAVAEAVEREKFIFVVAQRNANTDDPKFDDLYEYGTVAKIIQILRLPNNLLKVLVEGLFQAKIKRVKSKKDFLESEFEQVQIDFDPKNKELKAMIRRGSELFSKYIKENHNLPTDLIGAYENIADPLRKLYFAAANIQQKVEMKQNILEKGTLKEQYFELSSLLSSEIELLKLEDEIDLKVNDTIQKTQRKYYIQEQIRALQKELGDEEESTPELIMLKEAIEKADMPELAKAKALEEFDRLKKTPTMSPEYAVNRNFIELMTSLPWKEKSEDNLSIEHVKKILDEDHFDLEKPKDRILEYIAILNMAGTLKKQILCFVGPPGVGKTSLGRSVARALGRKFIRFSLGGIRDEAEIRGHRRTYVGAMPGKIIQSMKKAGTVNPVILLDEIDKMSMDFRGDPSAALLEVLDPEQNNSFNDHYLEVDYDLSNVMFITTANVRYDIPLPLQDRMEIIDISSYVDTEKLEIAKRHIVPKLIKEFGLEEVKLKITDGSIRKLIREYTRESGVRQLERELGSMLRKLVKEIIQNYDKTKKSSNGNGKSHKALKDVPEFKKLMDKKEIIVDEKKVEELLKSPKFKDRKELLEDKVGVATGLAWTSVGGEILPIEVSIMPGVEKLTLTGKLGDVMKESAKAGLSYVRSNAPQLEVPDTFSKKQEIHIHIPEGAIPKDGPSAGITMAIAMISAATGKAVRGDVAMTGEITLRGNILPIGGLKEKLLAAKRIGIKDVLIPEENRRDIEELSDEIIGGMTIHPIKHLSEALEIVFRENMKTTKVKAKTKSIVAKPTATKAKPTGRAK